MAWWWVQGAHNQSIMLHIYRHRPSKTLKRCDRCKGMMSRKFIKAQQCLPTVYKPITNINMLHHLLLKKQHDVDLFSQSPTLAPLLLVNILVSTYTNETIDDTNQKNMWHGNQRYGERDMCSEVVVPAGDLHDRSPTCQAGMREIGVPGTSSWF